MYITGSLSALVYQHSITPISLPCALRIPDKGKHLQHTLMRFDGTAKHHKISAVGMPYKHCKIPTTAYAEVQLTI